MIVYGPCVNPVAPLAGAWIEIGVQFHARLFPVVAPLAGAWIEIKSWRRKRSNKDVAPLAGAWIEIFCPYL